MTRANTTGKSNRLKVEKKLSHLAIRRSQATLVEINFNEVTGNEQ